MTGIKRHIKHWGLNVIVMIGSLGILLLFFEGVVFRYVLIASDIPQNEFVEGIIKYKPSQEGIYRVTDQIHARYRINLQGWNSGHQMYSEAKSPGVYRIAVIGDSYVEALQVDYDHSVAENLEEELGSAHYEVYRFAISGAPLSQYLHIFRQEVLDYHPDLVLFVLVHNDFKQSYQLLMGRYTPSFLRLRIQAGEDVKEIPPRPYRKPWYAWLRGTASYRYLFDRQRLNLGAIKRLLLKTESPLVYQANIDVSSLDEQMTYTTIATEYVFRQVREISMESQMQVLIVMDGDRGSIYKGLSFESGKVYPLHVMAAELARKYELPFLDLHDSFKEAFQRQHRSFNFHQDLHWNEYGHKIAAQSIAQSVRGLGY